jgi:hypothetical protein
MISQEAPDSQLLIKNPALGDPTNCAAPLERFGPWQIAPNRFLLEDTAPHHE